MGHDLYPQYGRVRQHHPGWGGWHGGHHDERHHRRGRHGGVSVDIQLGIPFPPGVTVYPSGVYYPPVYPPQGGPPVIVIVPQAPHYPQPSPSPVPQGRPQLPQSHCETETWTPQARAQMIEAGLQRQDPSVQGRVRQNLYNPVVSQEEIQYGLDLIDELAGNGDGQTSFQERERAVARFNENQGHVFSDWAIRQDNLDPTAGEKLRGVVRFILDNPRTFWKQGCPDAHIPTGPDGQPGFSVGDLIARNPRTNQFVYKIPAQGELLPELEEAGRR